MDTLTLSSGHLLHSTSESALAFLGHGGLTCQLLNKLQHTPPKLLAWNSTRPQERQAKDTAVHKSNEPWELFLLDRAGRIVYYRKSETAAHSSSSVPCGGNGLWLHIQGWAAVWARFSVPQLWIVFLTWTESFPLGCSCLKQQRGDPDQALRAGIYMLLLMLLVLISYAVEK